MDAAAFGTRLGLSEYFTTIITKSVTEQIERRNMARLRVFR